MSKKTETVEEDIDMQPVQVNDARSYFTPEVNRIMHEMSEEEMLQELTNLEGTRVWYAILKYNQIRLGYSQSALFAGDPFKEPTNMARNQGIMLGVSDLQNAIIILKKEAIQAEREATEEILSTEQ